MQLLCVTPFKPTERNCHETVLHFIGGATAPGFSGNSAIFLFSNRITQCCFCRVNGSLGQNECADEASHC